MLNSCSLYTFSQLIEVKEIIGVCDPSYKDIFEGFRSPLSPLSLSLSCVRVVGFLCIKCICHLTMFYTDGSSTIKDILSNVFLFLRNQREDLCGTSIHTPWEGKTRFCLQWTSGSSKFFFFLFSSSKSYFFSNQILFLICSIMSL
jgi:hypothetical protein